jgi:hypothetical protein
MVYFSGGIVHACEPETPGIMGTSHETLFQR